MQAIAFCLTSTQAAVSIPAYLSIAVAHYTTRIACSSPATRQSEATEWVRSHRRPRAGSTGVAAHVLSGDATENGSHESHHLTKKSTAANRFRTAGSGSGGATNAA